MSVKVGDSIPSVSLQEGQPDYGTPKSHDLDALCKGKKVIILAFPGAFTPTCSKSHLPSFMDAREELTAKGVDLVICTATNDPFVMEAWGKHSGGTDAGFLFLSDGSAELCRKFGLSIEGGVQVRSQRYTLVADDCVVTHFFSAAEEASKTWAPNVLAAL